MRRRSKKNDPPKRKRILRRPSRALRKIIKKTVRKANLAKKSPRAVIFSGPDSPSVVDQTSFTAPWQDLRLPSHYGENRLVLLVRDPWWIFAYWEITPQRQEECVRQIKRSGCTGQKTVLRVYDVTGKTLPKYNSFFDIELDFPADNWYVDVGLPDREWVAEIGFRVDGGRFFPLVRSNTVRTPSFGISDVLDEEWVLPEDIYTRLIGRSIGAGSTGGSMDIRKLLEKYLKNVVSSERRVESSQNTQTAGARAVSR